MSPANSVLPIMAGGEILKSRRSSLSCSSLLPSRWSLAGFTIREMMRPAVAGSSMIGSNSRPHHLPDREREMASMTLPFRKPAGRPHHLSGYRASSLHATAGRIISPDTEQTYWSGYRQGVYWFSLSSSSVGKSRERKMIGGYYSHPCTLAPNRAMAANQEAHSIPAVGENHQGIKQLSQAVGTVILAMASAWLFNQREASEARFLFVDELCAGIVILLVVLSLILLAELSVSAPNASGERILGCQVLYLQVMVYVFFFILFMLKLSAQVPLASFLRSSLMFLILLLGVFAAPHLIKRFTCTGFFRLFCEHFDRARATIWDLV